MTKNIKKYALSLFLVSLLVLPVVVSAQTGVDSKWGVGYGQNAGLGTKDVRDTVAAIINVALGILGIVALVIILIGGFRWMTAAGNEEAIGSAKKTIGAGVIGLIIIFVAYAVTVFIFRVLTSAT